MQMHNKKHRCNRLHHTLGDSFLYNVANLTPPNDLPFPASKFGWRKLPKLGHLSTTHRTRL